MARLGGASPEAKVVQELRRCIEWRFPQGKGAQGQGLSFRTPMVSFNTCGGGTDVRSSLVRCHVGEAPAADEFHRGAAK